MRDDEPDKADLHIAGRLDFNTTGLMLITNDGSWSRRLTQPQTKLPKVYYVETEQKIGAQYASTFAEGIYFAFEDLTTQPAHLELLGPRSARLSIVGKSASFSIRAASVGAVSSDGSDYIDKVLAETQRIQSVALGRPAPAPVRTSPRTTDNIDIAPVAPLPTRTDAEATAPVAGALNNS